MESKPEHSNIDLIESKRKKHLNQVGATRFNEISGCCNDVKLALTVYEIIEFIICDKKKQYNGHIFFILMV